MPIERIAERRLRGDEPVATPAVLVEDEADPGRTEHAMAVEDDNRPSVVEIGNGSIVAIAEVSCARHGHPSCTGALYGPQAAGR